MFGKPKRYVVVLDMTSFLLQFIRISSAPVMKMLIFVLKERMQQECNKDCKYVFSKNTCMYFEYINMWYSKMQCLPGVLPVKLRILPDEHHWLWFQPLNFMFCLLGCSVFLIITKRNHVQVRMAENMHLDLLSMFSYADRR